MATGIAGNSFFNPFIWDGLHYFNLAYDSQGRLATAREWNADNLVRFTWSGDRLSEIQAFRKESPTPYYQRTISYSGAMITLASRIHTWEIRLARLNMCILERSCNR